MMLLRLIQNHTELYTTAQTTKYITETMFKYPSIQPSIQTGYKMKKSKYEMSYWLRNHQTRYGMTWVEIEFAQVISYPFKLNVK